MDQTWVNGRVIRNTFGWGTRRTYPASGQGRCALATTSSSSTSSAPGTLAAWPARPTRSRSRSSDGTTVPLAGRWRYRPVPLVDGPAAPRTVGDDRRPHDRCYNGDDRAHGPLRAARGRRGTQGETNADEPAGYEKLLGGLMASWRSQFGAAPAVPDRAVAQLRRCSHQCRLESNWADLREAQRRARRGRPPGGPRRSRSTSVTGTTCIPPTSSTSVGDWRARHGAWSTARPSPRRGPLPCPPGANPGLSSSTFGDVERSLVSYSSSQATGFELCGADPGSCRFVSGEVGRGADRPSGDLRRRAGHPCASGSAGGPSPLCNLTDGSGLPVGPFEIPIGPVS
ncbi:MAG: hypothetical protein MZV63_23605 [Marinilabiliales bacterium]|nr:hypothetical protein [Marinilabiliales bacterium]